MNFLAATRTLGSSIVKESWHWVHTPKWGIPWTLVSLLAVCHNLWSWDAWDWDKEEPLAGTINTGLSLAGRSNPCWDNKWTLFGLRRTFFLAPDGDSSSPTPENQKVLIGCSGKVFNRREQPNLAPQMGIFERSLTRLCPMGSRL